MGCVLIQYIQSKVVNKEIVEQIGLSSGDCLADDHSREYSRGRKGEQGGAGKGEQQENGMEREKKEGERRPAAIERRKRRRRRRKSRCVKKKKRGWRWRIRNLGWRGQQR